MRSVRRILLCDIVNHIHILQTCGYFRQPLLFLYSYDRRLCFNTAAGYPAP